MKGTNQTIFTDTVFAEAVELIESGYLRRLDDRDKVYYRRGRGNSLYTPYTTLAE